MREWKNVISNKAYLPFACLFIVMMVIHMKYNLGGDDVYFGAQALTPDFFIERYMTRSSRMLTEGILVAVLHMPAMVWRVLDVAVVCSICYTITYLFVPKIYKIFGSWCIFVLFLLYPFKDLSSAGWGATTINYLWPMLFSLLACVPLKKMWNGEHISWKEKIFYLCMMVLAEDLELFWLMIVMVYGAGYFILNNKKRYYSLWVTQIIITIASLIKIITCPGNKARYMDEVGYWFPDYENLTIFDKINLGLTSMTGHFIIKTDVIMIILLLFLVVLVFKNRKNRVYRIISVIPLCTKIMGMILYHIGWDEWVTMRTGNPVSAMNVDCVYGYWPLLTSVLFFTCIMVSIYLIFGHSKKTFLIIWMFITGGATSFIMCFSPTLFASMDRYYFLFHVVIMILTLQCALQYKKQCK